MKFAYIVDEQIVEFREYPEDIERDPVMLRPVIVVPVTIQPWQIVASVRYDIFADHVDEVRELMDRPLPDVQKDKLADLENVFASHRASGFEFNADRFPLTDHSTKRQDLIRRSSSPGSFQVLNSSGALVTLPNSDKNAWLTAGDDAFAVLFTVHDQHFAAVNATTTPEQAATYNVQTGWPEPAPGPEPDATET